jgi:PAS domain S-box-containing protein
VPARSCRWLIARGRHGGDSLLPVCLHAETPNAPRLRADRGAGLDRRVQALSREASDRPAARAAQAPRRATPEQLARFQREYELLKALHLPGVARPIALASDGRGSVMVLEDHEGPRLENALAVPLAVPRTLRLAVQLAQALAGLHEAQIIHRDLRPANLLVDPERARLFIVDMSRASARAASTLDSDGGGAAPDGDLAYVSPEQTGRLRSPVDHRSDLYSLGVVLYHLFSGVLPFHASDPLEWVHAHVARTAAPLAQARPDVPAMISDIVMKLLCKAPDERYQSARGLEVDLERCLLDLEARGKIDPFEPGAEDVADRFQVPKKLYGRERELAALHESYERAARGDTELVLVSGYSGIGKSALVHELQRLIVKDGGSFISGKFDERGHDIPYAALAQAFRLLVQQTLAGSEEQIAKWRRRLGDALGDNAEVITAIIPDLELIIGKPPAAPTVGALEAKNRFHATFCRFLSVFPQPERPVALFLDDLHWADSASLELLDELLTLARLHHLLVIGAYRDSDITPAHPLLRMLEHLRDAGTRTAQLPLQPLTPEDMCLLLVDAFHCSPEAATPLARLVCTKTGGDPFFATQFLTTLDQDHLIEFVPSAKAWRWDVRSIATRDYTDNVAELMLARLRRLPEATRALLTTAACLGSEVHVTTLAVASECTEEVVHEALRPARDQGLMLRTSGTYRFLHDRIRQGAYSLIAEAERADAHLRLGRRLRAHALAGAREADPFEIGNQLMLGISRLDDGKEREEVTRLFLACGRRAKASTAYAVADSFFTAGASLLAADSWVECHQLTYELHLERADCDWLVGRFEDAERLLVTLLAHARTDLEKLAVYDIQVRLHTIRGQLSRSIESGLDALRLIGIDLSAHPTPEDVQRVQRDTWHELEGRSIESLLELPLASKPEVAAVLGLTSSLLDVAAFTDKNLLQMLATMMVSTSIRHGNSEGSSVGYAAYAMVQLDLDRRDEAHRFGRLACDLLERLGANTSLAKVATYVEGTLNPWIKPYRSGLSYLDSAAHKSAQNGDYLWTGYCLAELVWLLFVAGEPLASVDRESQKRLAQVRSMKALTISDNFVSLQVAIASLRGVRFGDGFDEVAYETTLEAERMPVVVCSHYIWKMQARFILGDFAGALAASAKAKANLWGLYRLSTLVEFQFYDALTRAALHRDALPEQQQEHLATLVAHEQALRACAEHCPQNFAGKQALLAAEIARIEGRELLAQRGYEQAIHLAATSGLVQNQAIANELAARFSRSLGLDSTATVQLREARDGYARWGADAKVKQLEAERPLLFERRAPAADANDDGSRAARVLPGGQLDLLAVIKASQAISREMVLSDLLETLMRVVLESAGAQTASLLLPRGSELALIAVASVNASGVSVRRLEGHVPGETELPLSILNYVRHSGAHVLLNDDGQANPFAVDAYLAKRPFKSILCLPMRRQAELIGILYLENRLIGNAFTPDRLAMFELLAGQMAISLENAQLYTDLRRENSERQQAEAALRESQALLQSVIDNTAASIFVKDLEGRFLLVNRHLERLLGAERGALLGKSDADLFPPEQAEAVRAADRSVLAAGTPLELEETVPLEGGMHTYLSIKAPLTDSAGRAFGLCGISTDITERKRAEAALRKSEEQLRQSQKMEAIGNLAGGIAHDFNNLLSIILSYSGMLAHDMTPSDPRRADLQEIEAAGTRAAELTRQLLAFGRKQILQPKVVNLNDILVGMERMLKRLIGEDIELRLVTNPNLGRTLVDPGQFEQIVMNLAINSRDAMPLGGRLTLEATNVDLDTAYAAEHVGATAGPHVMLAVTDSGVGMDAATQAHMFEPFFTTKEKGKGTGLGLATVFGIVQQSGGNIWVYSEPGKGTCFKIYLPRTDAVAVADATPALQSGPLVGTETILLVEDDERVRALARTILDRHGYHVLEAQSGGDALLICEEHPATIHLLITDVIMPRMSGRQLAERLQPLRPHMKVLFMSGYTDNSIVHHGVLDSGVAFLQKPLTPETLTRKVREVLGASQVG